MKKKTNVIRKIIRFWFRHKSGDGLEAKLGYRFKDASLLAHALVHRSWIAGKDIPYTDNNERLEFLGDSILNMLATEYLYKTHPKATEGDLSKWKGAIVSGHALAQTSFLWNLCTYIRIGKSEVRMGGRYKENILADAFEAILGAVYLDAGLDAVRTILETFHFPRTQSIVAGADFLNYKSTLLEAMQAKSLPLPEYEVIGESGPEHHKVFDVQVLLEGKVCGRGSGVSKKKAEQEAAACALKLLEEEEK